MTFHRRRVAATGAGLLASAALGAFSSARAESHKKDAASLASAVEAFRQAMLKGDKHAFETLCSDKLTYGHSSGRIETKPVFVNNATSGKSVWKTLEFKDLTNIVADDTGISRFILTGQTESAGKTNDINIGVLMVWREEDDKWKLLARQAYKI